MKPALWQPLPRGLWFVLGVYAALVLAYNFVQPPFEPSDEFIQFGYIRYLVDHAALPVARPGEQSSYHHPPAYFALAAALSWRFPAQDLADYAGRVNPYALYRYWEPGVDNKNLYLHGPWDGWPFHDTALAVRATRLISLALGLVTVVLTYQTGAALFDPAAGLAAAGLAAFTPMFTSLSGALQNDLGAAAAGAVVIWLGIWLARAGVTLRRAALLGALAGLAVLMKLTALGLTPAAGLLVLAAAWREPGSGPRGRRALGLLAAFAAGAGAVAGWWFWRNWQLYGDLTAMNINLANFGGQASLADGLRQWPDLLPYAWTTYWGRIGHGSIVLADWMYQALAVLTAAALAGLVQRWRRTGLDLGAGFSLAAVAFVLAGLLAYLTVSPTGGNGRYMYSGMAAAASLWAGGMLHWAAPQVRQRAAAGLAGLMAAFSLAVLLYYVWPVYSPPPALAGLPASASPLNANLGGTVRLRGYEVSAAEAQPGEIVEVTVYWEPLSQTDRPYSVYLHLLDAAGQPIAQRDTFPGLGRNPTTAWTPGQLFSDRYRVLIPPDAPTPLVGHWKAGLWQADSGDYAFLLDPAGQPVDSGATFGQLTIQGP